MRRHLHAVRFGDSADFLQFQNAAGVADVRLDVIHQVAVADFGEAVLGEDRSPVASGVFVFWRSKVQLAEVFELCRLLHQQRAQAPRYGCRNRRPWWS